MPTRTVSQSVSAQLAIILAISPNNVEGLSHRASKVVLLCLCYVRSVQVKATDTQRAIMLTKIM